MRALSEKSKYRCDHVKPICGRCQSRGISTRCIYHPAPMRGLTTPKGRRTTALQTPPSTTPESEVFSQQEHSRPPDEDVGFLGSTAFNAVFTDNEDRIPSTVSTKDQSASFRDILHEQITTSQKVFRKSFCKLDTTYVMECLKDFSHLSKIADRWPRSERSCCTIGPWLEIARPPSARICMKEVLSDAKDQNRLRWTYLQLTQLRW